jgi:anion-transporting  ArsA/GET3 family ATPase
MESLLQRDVVLVTGKGGVGKTTVAAALALRAARLGLRPLLVSCEGKATVGRILGGPDERPSPTELVPGVHAIRVDYDVALSNLVAEILGAKRLVEAFLHNRVVRTFVRAAPSVMELCLLHRLDAARRPGEPGGPYRPIIVDLPASGHALALISTPRAIMRLVRVGPLYRRAQELLSLCTDPRQTAMCVVTLAEELPINETIELVAKAQGLGVPVGHVVVNAVPPAPLSDEDSVLMSRLAQDAHDPLCKWAREVLDGNTRGRRARDEIQRLTDVSSGPVAQVPFVADMGPKLAGAVCEALGGHA